MPPASDGEGFEAEVARIACCRWPNARSGGPTMVDGRERDGLYETDEMIHLVECTTSRTKIKAEKDIGKLQEHARKLLRRDPQKAVKGWFVTRDEPTAEQLDVARRTSGQVVAVSFARFQSALIDVHQYLEVRNNAPFGSMSSPSYDGDAIAVEYVSLDIIQRGNGRTWSVDDIADALTGGQRISVLGDYGAGKSTTLHEVFLKLRGEHYRKKITSFPVLLNLRDHAGQQDPVEALERHARRIGFDYPGHLVRAWRAGYALLILDGFDELATAGWAGRVKKLKDLRYRSMELVRRFIAESPRQTGLIVAGREHYFDSKAEREQSLGTGGQFHELTLNEFTESQVAMFLRKHGWQDGIPTWLPSRPLLLGYLAARKLLTPRLLDVPSASPADGWNHLLACISQREAAIEVGIDAGTVRAIIERLATRARNSVDGLGPLTQRTIVETFTEICGYEPDDRGLVLLQRLPGLGVHDASDGTRRFIDQSLVDAARAGDVTHFVVSPHSQEVLRPEDWSCCLDQLGVELAATQLAEVDKARGLLSAAIAVALNAHAWGELGADLFQVTLELGYDYVGANCEVRDVSVPRLELGPNAPDLSRLTFMDCYFGLIGLDPEADSERFPSFRSCYVAALAGRVGEEDLPSASFIDCEFDEFDDNAKTTQSILRLDLPLRVKVMLTLLKKLYAQRGSARKESALFRGLDQRARMLVPDVLEFLQSHGLTAKAKSGGTTLWLPVRDARARVLRLLSAPSESDDPILAW